MISIRGTGVEDKMMKQRRGAIFRNSENPKVSVVIPVYNESKTLPQVIKQAYLLHNETEVIVVSNGSSDGTRELAERIGAKVIYFREPLGHDVGRSLGAREARGDIILFIDGDMVIPTSGLIPFIDAVQRGIDVAMNQYSGSIDKKEVHKVVSAKFALNAILGRPDLRGASMTAVPHAMSRRALAVIGWEHLAIPPKAQTIAITKGLQVEAVHNINVGKLNPKRRKRRSGDPVGNLIVGDHLEAIRWLTQNTDRRAMKPDLDRKREIVR